MKNVLFALLLIPSITWAIGNSESKSGAIAGAAQAQGQTQGQNQGQSQGQTSQNESNLNDSSSTTSNVKTSYDSVSASAADLQLAYCADGASAQAEEGGFSVGNVNFICEAVMSIKAALPLVKNELDLANMYRGENKGSLEDLHLVRANVYMEEIREIMEDVLNYIDGRANTAGIGAASRDLAVPFAMGWLLIFLL